MYAKIEKSDNLSRLLKKNSISLEMNLTTDEGP